MQVSVESTSNLGRRLTVVLPTEQFENEIHSRLKNFGKTAKIEGFRPGKIPDRVIEQRFGETAKGEAIDRLLKKSLNEALIQEKLEPASTPMIESFTAEKGKPFEYTATFEIFPEIKLENMSDLVVEKLQVEIHDHDVDRVLEQMRLQHAQWKPVERAAKENDKIFLDLKWPHEEKPDQFRDQKGVAFVLGKNLPKELEVLLGKKIGDDVELKLAIQVKGKNERTMVQSTGKVVKIEEPILPELNDDFAKKLEVTDGIAGLRSEVQQHMQQQADHVMHSKLRNKIVEALLERHHFELPQQVVESEKAIIEQDIQRQQKTALTEADKKNLTEMAKKRVSLSLIYSALIKEYQMKVDYNRVKARVEQMAAIFEDPTDVAKKMLQDQATVTRVSTEVMEDQLIEKLIEKVQYSNKKIPYAEAMGLEHDHDH